LLDAGELWYHSRMKTLIIPFLFACALSLSINANASEFLAKTIQCGGARVQIFITAADQIIAGPSKVDSFECENGGYNEQSGMPVCKSGSSQHVALSSVIFNNIARVRYEVLIGSKSSTASAMLFGESVNESGYTEVQKNVVPQDANVYSTEIPLSPNSLAGRFGLQISTDTWGTDAGIITIRATLSAVGQMTAIGPNQYLAQQVDLSKAVWSANCTGASH
jgi:hypothetical protein